MKTGNVTVEASATSCISGWRRRILSSLFKLASAWNGDYTLHRLLVVVDGNPRRGKGANAARPLGEVATTVRTDGPGSESESALGVGHFHCSALAVSPVILLIPTEILSAYGSSCM